MSKSERVRDKYPIFGAYGDRQSFLNSEDTAKATREDRIQSIWPFIVRRVLAFQATLTPREQANFDPEDTLAELWVAIAERDEAWTPERGRYITFAGIIIDRELCTIRERARTVESPRNTSCRIKEYVAEEESGTLSTRRRKTLEDIKRTGAVMNSIAPRDEKAGIAGQTNIVDENAANPLDEVASLDNGQMSRQAIREAMRTLTNFEALVVGMLNGLNGKRQRSVWEVAWLTQKDEADIRKIAKRASDKMRLHLLSVGHPAIKIA